MLERETINLSTEIDNKLVKWAADQLQTDTKQNLFMTTIKNKI